MEPHKAEWIEQRLSEGAAIAPTALDWEAGRIELTDLERVECCEPFFQQTLKRLHLERPDSCLGDFELDRFTRAVPRQRAAPDGIIFHAGRCGSTLLANMLAASGRYSVLREPGTVIDLSLAWLDAGENARPALESLLALIVPQMLWATAGGVRYRLLKPAAWNIQLAHAVLRMFPNTPAVFLYRAPSETVASMLCIPPGWMEWIEMPRSSQARYLPSLHTFSHDVTITPAILFAHAWRSAVEAALTLPTERLLFLNYASMASDPRGSLNRVLAHFGHPAGAENIEAMLGARSIYSKAIGKIERFDPGGIHRRRPLNPREAAQVEMVVGGLWRRIQVQGGI